MTIRTISGLVGVSVIAGLVSGAFVVSAQADPLERGLQGVIGGAIIGGVLGGGKGAGRGAAIGGAVGIIGGAMEESDRRREEAYEDRQQTYYRDAPPSSPLVEDIQSSLVRLGYKPGPVDGVMGGKTADAIGQYQDEHGLLVTRQPSQALLTHLRKNGG